MRLLLAVSVIVGLFLECAEAGQVQAAPRGAAGWERTARTYCSGAYADDLAYLSKRARELQAKPSARYSYCVRNTASYECLSYDPEGNVQRRRHEVKTHGTAFGYRSEPSGTLLLTNEHVAEWRQVTDDSHLVRGVPPGCKRVSQTLTIVDDEKDSFETDDVQLEQVVTDRALDVAVLKAPQKLHIMPWKVGRSALLRERNVVEVHGFPLGAFRATNLGKVVSAYDHDDYKDWDHDDFVIDALLSPGSSGSPVLAVSCATGEFELVGIYHAGYTSGSALNVVVGIDQVEDLMTTLTRTPRPAADEQALDQRMRAGLVQAAGELVEPFFGFGSLPAVARVRPDGTLVFVVFSGDFPTKVHPILIVEDLPTAEPSEFGQIGRVWFGGSSGLKVYTRAELEADTQARIAKTLDVLRRDAHSAYEYRMASREAPSSREGFERVGRLEQALSRTAAARSDVVASVIEVSQYLSTRAGNAGQSLAEVLRASPVSDAPGVDVTHPDAEPLDQRRPSSAEAER